MKKIFLLLILLGIVVINTTCSKERLFHKITWEGTLYDTIGGHPVSGVQILLHACVPSAKDQCDNYLVGTSWTDGSGHFKIYNHAARSNRYAFQIGAGKFSGDYFGDFKIDEGELRDKYSKLYIKH